MYPIIFIDTETTGLDPQRAAVIEVAMIRREADGSETRYHTYIKPTEHELANAVPKALEINGYAADSSPWDIAPYMSEVGHEITAFTKGAKAICGHNVSFDENMIKAAFKRHSVEGRIPYHKIDTVTLAHEHLTPLGLHKVSLDKIRGFLGWSMESAHTAMKDTEDAMTLFDLLWRMTPWRRFRLRMRLYFSSTATG